MDTVTVGKECEGCRYYELIEESKKDIFVYCEAKEKKFYYGQRISCEDKEKS